jgi:hypothetical protein
MGSISFGSSSNQVQASVAIVDRWRRRRVIPGRWPVIAVGRRGIITGCIAAIRCDRGPDAEAEETADYRRPGCATAAVVMITPITPVPMFSMNGRGYRQTRDKRRGTQEA